MNQHQQLVTLLSSQILALFRGDGKGLPMLRVRVRVRLVAVGLPRLCQQDERGRIGRLETEGEV